MLSYSIKLEPITSGQWYTLSFSKGPFKNYVILLEGEEGRSPKDNIRLQGGRGDTPKNYIGLQGGVNFVQT